MTSYTAQLGLPYPDDTDLVVEGDDAIQALAEAVEARIGYDASVTVDPATSGRAVGGAIAVDFTGAENVGGFSRTGDGFTYTGAGSRFFLVAAHVEVENGGTSVPSVESTVYVTHNGAVIASGHDRLVATIENRRVVHHVIAPVQLAPGDAIDLTAYASPAGTLGTTSIRIYPIGPELP